MPIVRRRAVDLDREKLLAELAARPRPSEEQIDRWAAEDGDAWNDDDIANAVLVHPPLTPEQLRELRGRLGLTQFQFAHRFGFTVDAVQRYEEGRQVPSGPASTLLRVIASDAEAVVRALDSHLPDASSRRHRA
jgi:putative transcriptional regulator